MSDERPNITVYRASAGSGKTYTLAAEYIARLLAWPDPRQRRDPFASPAVAEAAADSQVAAQHRHVLAVTFTNKATTEMKERILQRLYDLAQGQNEGFRKTLVTKTFYAERLNALGKDELRRRAAVALRGIVHDYDRFYVQTIDKFFQQLLASLARELGLSTNYRVDIDDRGVVEGAVEHLLSSLNEPATSVDGVGPERKRLVAWIRDYIDFRTQEGKSWNLKEDLSGFAGGNVLREDFQRNKDKLRETLKNDDKIAHFRAELAIIRQRYAPGGAGYASLETIIGDVRRLFDSLDRTALHQRGRYLALCLDKCEGSLVAVLDSGTMPFSPSVEAYMNGDSPLLKDGETSDFSLRDGVALLLKRLNELRAAFHDAFNVLNSCRIVMRNLNQLRLLGELSDEVDALNREHNRFMLSQTKKLFSELVKDYDAPFVFEKSGLQFHHIMIDEFQDTARTQWNNLKKLIIEGQASGDTCLLVGDVKQSIYRFNGGDWRILANIDKELPGRVANEHLRENYRSECEVVQFNNEFFRHAPAYIDEMAGNKVISEIYETSESGQECTRPTHGGCVRISISGRVEGVALDETDERVGYNLYTQINRLHEAGVAYSEMAILVRRRAEGRQVMEHFALHHPEIPFVSDEAFFYENSPAVQLIIDAMRYLHSCICRNRDDREGRKSLRHRDTVALANVLRIYHNYIKGEDIPMDRIAADPEAFSRNELVENPFFLYRMPLYGLCARLCEMFELSSLGSNERTRGQAAYVLGFLDEVDAFQQDNPSDVELFLKYWDDRLSQKSIPGTEADGIQVVTIHKSKGLAYHSVFVPFCDWDIERVRGAADSYLWSTADKAPFDTIEHFPVNQTKMAENSAFGKAYAEEIEQLRVEALNLAYVAFTRPKCNLMVWAVARNPKDIHSRTMGDIVALSVGKVMGGAGVHEKTEGVEVYEAGSPYMPAAASRKSSGKAAEEAPNPFEYGFEPEPMSLSVSGRNVRFRQSNESAAFLKSDDEPESGSAEYIRRGNLYHAVLSQVITPEDVLPAVRALCRQGLLAHDEIPKIAGFIEERVCSSVVASWFDGTWEMRTETEIYYTDAKGERQKARPDRVMLRGDEAVVVDYKFGRPRPEHKAQVAHYTALLSQMGYRQVSGYLWYVYENTLDKTI